MSEEAGLEAGALIDRLRSEMFSGRHAIGGGTTGHTDGDGIFHPGKSWGGQPIMVLCNPDGPTAAALIEQLASQLDAANALLWEAHNNLGTADQQLTGLIDRQADERGDLMYKNGLADSEVVMARQAIREASAKISTYLKDGR